MAPRGRRRMTGGQTREDAARDNMRDYGFKELVITQAIKELREVYGEDGWRLIEDGGYSVLLERCLEKQGEQANQVAEAQNKQVVKAQNQEVAETHNEEMAQEQDIRDVVQREHGLHVEDVRDHVGRNSTSLLGSGTETRTQTCQTDTLLITNNEVMDSSTTIFQSVASNDAHGHGPFTGATNSNFGGIKEEVTNPDEDSEGDDDEIIQLVPEPLCPELQELLRKVREQNKRKRPSRWDN